MVAREGRGIVSHTTQVATVAETSRALGDPTPGTANGNAC